MKITAKLFLAFFTLSAFVVVIGYASFTITSRAAYAITHDFPESMENIKIGAKEFELARDIIYYDEVLTQSARNYAFTQDAKWKERYRAHEPLLDATIKEAIEKGDGEEEKFFAEVDTANLALIGMEYTSLSLVDNGSASEAIVILESDEYAGQKAVYAAGIQKYLNQSSREYITSVQGSVIALDAATADIEGSVAKGAQITFFVLTIFSLLSFIVSFSIARSISFPLQKLSAVAKNIGEGNLGVETGIRGKDEIGSLALSIDLMGQKLKESQHKLVMIERKRSEELEREVDKKTKDLQKNIDQYSLAQKAMFNMMDDLKDANKKLKELDNAKSEFLNIVSHELKTPLTAITAYIDILQDSAKKLDDQENAELGAIKRNSGQLRILIDNILEIARLESNKFELIYREFDMNTAIKEVIENVKSIAINRKLELKASLGSVPIITADEMRIKEVITNFISNSLKFTEKGGITVQSEQTGDYVKVSVIDTGIGIPKDKIQNLFTNFYQVDASLNRKYGGTGLGLALSKKIVELQGGKIVVESTMGKGSIFSFLIPIKTKHKEVKA